MLLLLIITLIFVIYDTKNNIYDMQFIIICVYKMHFENKPAKT